MKIYDNKLKPKRVKVEFVKVVDSIWELRGQFERGELYWWYESDCKDKSEFVGIRSEYDLSTYFAKGNIYRKVETEIDERQEFIDAACKVVPTTAEEDIKVMEKMFDSGKFKLVDNQ